MTRSLSIKNLGPIREMDLDLDTNVVVLSGPHGSGKSTIVNGFTLTLFGETSRLRLKKDLYQMIHGEADKAVVVYHDGQAAMTCTITGKGRRGAKVDPTEMNKVQMSFPWEVLQTKPSIWKDMIGSAELDWDKLKAVIDPLPNAWAVYSANPTNLEDIIKILEGARLELHRQVKDPVEPQHTMVLNGQEIHLGVYLKNEDHYQRELQDLRTRHGAAVSRLEHKRTQREHWLNSIDLNAKSWEDLAKYLGLSLNYEDVTTEDLEAQLIREQESIKGIREGIMSLKSKVKEIELSAEPCPTCGKAWPKDLEGYKNEVKEAEDMEQQAYTRAKWLEHGISLHRAISAPVPQAPTEEEIKEVGSIKAQMDAADALLLALHGYKRDLGAKKTQEEKNEQAKKERKQIQSVIETLRSPEFVQSLMPDTKIEDVRNLIKEACEVLTIPRVHLEDDLTLSLWLGDGASRSVSLLSDTQRTLAGLAVVNAFAQAQKERVLIVDQVDWVHGQYIKQLALFLQMVAEQYDLVLVATANEVLARQIEVDLKNQGVSHREYRLTQGVASVVSS